MSSNELSGASAEATATNPAFPAESSFGSTRGSGLARGKGKRPSAPAASTAASSTYTPTAIEVVTAPREYQNPFAPVETPAPVTPEAAPVAAPAPAAYVPPARPERAEVVTPVKEYSAPVAREVSTPVQAPAAIAPEAEEQAELNILPPEQQKSVPAQTWESEGFRPAREPRNDRPRREESPRRDEPRPERAPREEIPTPAKFLYVRPGYNYVPTPSNYGSAPRERHSTPAVAATQSPETTFAAAAPKASGGFFGWLKSLFGGSETPAPAAVESRQDEARQGDRQPGGRNRNHPGGGDSQRRRNRGGRGRSQRGGEYRSGGSDQGNSSAT